MEGSEGMVGWVAKWLGWPLIREVCGKSAHDWRTVGAGGTEVTNFLDGEFKPNICGVIRIHLRIWLLMMNRPLRSNITCGYTQVGGGGRAMVPVSRARRLAPHPGQQGQALPERPR